MFLGHLKFISSLVWSILYTPHAIEQQVWKQRTIKIVETQVDFDNDYSPELQRKCAQVRYAVKQLKQKNIKAKCVYPVWLRMTMRSEEKTFQKMMGAVKVLQEMNIKVQVDEQQQELAKQTRCQPRRLERQHVY